MYDESRPAFDGAGPEDVVAKVFRVHRRPAFTSFLSSAPVVEILRDVLGDDIDCFLSQFIFKNPGAWGQPWHQDSFYFNFDPPRPICALWLAVSEATLDNGCLHALSGSHRDPVHTHSPDRRPGSLYGYYEVTDVDDDSGEAVLMDPGDLLVFDSHLLHRSTDNRSDRARAAMVFHLCPAGTVDLGRAQVPSDPETGVVDFMPLVRDGACVVAIEHTG